MRKVYKDVIRSVIPHFMLSFIKNILRFVFYKGSVGLRSVEFYKKNPDVIVLGNGPCLKDDMIDIEKKISQFDFVCVNNFCSSPYYTKFKPGMYVFLDAYFFSQDAHNDWVVQREKTFSIINEETSWPMKIFLPYGADELILKAIINNPNIEIIKLNVLGLDSKICNSYTNFLFNTGYYGPPQINVLIYAVYLAIWAKYKSISIFGADMSFHKDIDVDQSDNELFMRYRHFNGDDYVEKLRKNPQKQGMWSMGEIMKLTSDTFYAHNVLNQYSKMKGVKIYNASSYSLIDSYARKKES